MKTGTLIILVIFLLTPSCTPKKVKTTPGPEFIFYPPLPNSPRYQYLTTFSTSKDIEKQASKFLNFIAGDEQKPPKVIKRPYGVDIHDGVIYVCDTGGGVVAALNLKTNKFNYIGIKGSGKLKKPVNLAIDRTNNMLFVADNGTKQVLCYNLQGKFIKAYGKKDQFSPVDVEIFADKLYICGVKKHQIFVLERKSGKLLYKIGKPGSNVGEFFHPTNICIMNDRLYVSDTSNFRIQIFDLNGKFLAKFGKIGRRPGNFVRNKGISVSKQTLRMG